MVKRRLVVALALACCALLPIAGCNGTATEKAELESQVTHLREVLEETKTERDSLKQDVAKLRTSLDNAESSLTEQGNERQTLAQRVAQLGAARDDLQIKLGELTKSRNELKARVVDLEDSGAELQTSLENLASMRVQLQERVDELVKARDAALVDARKAQTKIDDVQKQLQSQVEQVGILREQMTNVRAVLDQLQQKLQ